MPKKPEEWRDQISREKTKGAFKLFLGYAPGVGKTYAMLSEGVRRRGYFEDKVGGSKLIGPSLFRRGLFPFETVRGRHGVRSFGQPRIEPRAEE